MHGLREKGDPMTRAIEIDLESIDGIFGELLDGTLEIEYTMDGLYNVEIERIVWKRLIDDKWQTAPIMHMLTWDEIIDLGAVVEERIGL